MLLLRALAIAVLLLAGPDALASPFDDAVAKLGSDDFSEKIAAVEQLGILADGRAIAPLRALSDGKLHVAADGRTFIVDGVGVVDAVTGERRPEGAADLARVRVNNRVRSAVTAALSQLQLFSPDRGDRLAAAREAFRQLSPESAAALRRALASEADAEIRRVIEFSLVASEVATGSKESRLAAIAKLRGSTDPQVRSLLGQVAGAADTDGEVRDAAQSAIAAIESRLRLFELLANLFQGISLGSILLLAAIGLAITFGVMGVINMAHGEMIMLGAYSAYVVQELFRAFLPVAVIDLYLLAALPVAFLVAGAVGVALERGIIRHLYGRPLETLLATWGISLMLQQAVRSIFGAPNKEVANPSWMTGGFDVVGGFSITWNRLVIIVFCFLVLGLIALVIRRTSFGLHMRAVTQNRDMASAMGIPTARVDALTFGLGSAIAGMAGVALSQIGNVSPNLGQIYIVDSFLVVVFGGVGSLLGTLVGALGLGVVNKFLEPFAGAVLGKIVVLVLVILFIQRRPRGLFALKGRMADA